jgi:DNA transposition AAA+ family ATPase
LNEQKTDGVSEADDELMKHVGDTVRASWNYSADNIRANTAHMKAQETELLISLFRWCIDPRHPVKQEDAAAKIGCSSQLIYQLMTGKYRNPDKSPKGPSTDFMKNVREFLILEAKRFLLGKTEFVMTPTAKKIITALDLARESQSIVFIYGPSHIGKTWTAELHYTPANNHGKTIYCRMKAASGLGGMVRAMAKAIGISDKSNTADLIERIINATSPNTLWILDEVHLLANTYRRGSFFGCMEVIREIFDRSECGMALIFTMLDDVKAASQRELQQLWRRGVHKVPLPLMPTKGDIGAILKHAGFEGEPVMSEGRKKEEIGIFPAKDFVVMVDKMSEQPYEILRQQARVNGLKAITERIRYARKLSDRAGARGVTWQHFVEAHLRIEKQAQQEPEWS